MNEERDASRTIDAVAFVALSEGLKNAFAKVSAADLPHEERARWQRRLVAITDAAKRDLPRAQSQLDRYGEDWRARWADTPGMTH